MNTKGSLQGVVIAIVSLFALSLFILVFLRINTDISDAMQDSALADIDKANASIAKTRALPQDKADYIFLGVFIALVIGILITGYFATAHPIFIIFYLLGLVIVGVVSGVLQYTWETFSTNSELLSYVSFMPVANWIMTNLVMLTVIIGFLGVVMLYIGYNTRPEY